MRPHWEDRCRHDRVNDRFLGTIAVDGKPQDVYVYQDNELSALPDMHVCIRYGSHGNEYISPGPVARFLGQPYEEFEQARQLVLAWAETR